MLNKTNIFQRVDYAASKRNGRITTVGETWLALMNLATIKPEKKYKAPVEAKKEPIPAGKQLFLVMMQFYKMGLHVVTETVGNKKFMKAVELNKKTFPVSYSKKMNRVVIWDDANKKSLTLEQFIAMVGKPKAN